MSAQLLLAMGDFDRAQLGAARIRRACRTVVEAVGAKTIADAWGCAERAVLLKVDQRERHYLHPEELLDLVLRDRHGRIVAELADVAGYEMPERKRVLEPGEKLARLEATLDEQLGAELAELVRRKAGLLT